MREMYIGGVANTNAIEIWGLSNETKPINVPDCSVFLEKNTGDIYVFELSNLTWYKI